MKEGLGIDALELWRGDRRLINGLGFHAAPGDIVHIAGSNGSGKTTLLRAACGLTHPESGAIRYNGTDIRHDLPAYHSELAWLGHRDGLKPELTAAENLADTNRLQGTSIDPEVVARAEIGVFEMLPVRALSAGQKRRVALTRVFGSRAPVWLLDEPFANLDIDGRQWGMAEIERHVDRGGICLLSTHLPVEHPRMKRVEIA